MASYTFREAVAAPSQSPTRQSRLRSEQMHSRWDDYARMIELDMVQVASALFTTHQDEHPFWEVSFAVVNLADDLEVLRQVNMARHELWEKQLLDELAEKVTIATLAETWPNTYVAYLMVLTMPPFMAVCSRTIEADGPTPLLTSLADRIAAFNANRDNA